MGLDMCLGVEAYKLAHIPGSTREQLFGLEVESYILKARYWRKHPNLRGFIVNNFAEGGEDNGERIDLDRYQLLMIAEALEKWELPETEGFFFGNSDSHKETAGEDALFIRALADEFLPEIIPDLAGGVSTSSHTDTEKAKYSFSVFYRASW